MRTDIARMASEVIAGKHGIGHVQRQASLGVAPYIYEMVRNHVNIRMDTYEAIRNSNPVSLRKLPTELEIETRRAEEELWQMTEQILEDV